MGSNEHGRRPLITLLTDFGLTDPFVAEMKAVILSICHEATVVDISHQVEKFDIRMGSFLLASAVPYFPSKTVHVALVDPGVGSKRRAIVLETSRSVLVGPDNGLLIPAAQAEGILHVYELTNTSMMRHEISTTFHGRDIFAPAAAHLACGTSPKDCGPEIADYVKPSYAEPIFKGKAAICEVYHIDGFGNVITNLRQPQLPKLDLNIGQEVQLDINRRSIFARFVGTYSDLTAREYGVLVSSHGFVEIACREQSAAKRLRVRRGDHVKLQGGT